MVMNRDVLTDIQRKFDWTATLAAGIAGAIVMLVLYMALVPMVMGLSMWHQPHLIAAIVMGREVLPTTAAPATFDMGIIAAAMGVHLPLSILYAFILSALVSSATRRRAIGIGVMFGIILYMVNFYIFAPILFDWFTAERTVVSAISHVVFGVVVVAVYKSLQRGETWGQWKSRQDKDMADEKVKVSSPSRDTADDWK